MAEQQLLNAIQEKGTSLLQTKGFDIQNIYRIVVIAMETIEDFPNFSGAQKKEVVIEVIRKLVNLYIENNGIEESELTLTLVDAAINPIILGALVDLVVSTAKGEFNIKLGPFKKLWKSLCNCSKAEQEKKND